MTCSHNPCIKIQNASVFRNRKQVLKNINLITECGEFVVIVGPNGAGKTTLLLLICGLLRTKQGHIQILGTTPNFLTAHKLRRRIGFVSQIHRFDPRLPITVKEFVAIGRSAKIGLGKRLTKYDWEVVHQVLTWVGITHLTNEPLGCISGGEYQRSAIARALAQEPEIFLFDEPTAFLDPKASQEIISLIQRIHSERHTTTIYVTHDLHLLPTTSQRIIIMQNGKISEDNNHKGALNIDSLQEWFSKKITLD